MKRQILVICIFLLTIVNMVLAQTMTVKDSDLNVLMQVNDEGAAGTITLPQGAVPGVTTNKLYNVSGTLYWNGGQLGTGATEINDLTDGKTGGNSVFLGSGAGTNDDGTDNKNVAVGYSALDTNSTGYSNMAIGYQALYSNTTGHSNTASGYQALYSNTIGNSNTASGIQALYGNTEGDCNTASGFGTLFINISGDYNTAIGGQALFNNQGGNCNTACGVYALICNNTGNNNTAVGYYADRSNQDGSNNTIIGYEAAMGTSVHDKSGNVIIGYQAGYSADEAANRNIFIGYQAGYSETDSCKLYIENSNSSSPLIGGDFKLDRVGINTNSPSVTLHVSGTDAILVPVGTTLERPSSPVAGMIRFNSDTNQFEGYNGSAWVQLDYTGS